MDGQQLTNCFENACQRWGVNWPLPPWLQLPGRWPSVFDSVAQDINAHFGNPMLVPAGTMIPIRQPVPVPAVPPSPEPNWKILLEMYGRHKPTCPTSAPCDCGFAEVERKL